MILPKPGDGPSLKLQREEGFWRLELIGYPEDSNAKHVLLELADNHGDPGYWSTSKMLLECALSLILEKARVDEMASHKGLGFRQFDRGHLKTAEMLFRWYSDSRRGFWTSAAGAVKDARWVCGGRVALT